MLATGIGAVPAGSGSEDVSSSVRNIALRRAVYQSSAYNYEDTGHLVTDGIKSQVNLWEPSIKPQYEDSPAAEGPSCAFDGNTKTKWLTFHNAAWLQIAFPGTEQYTAVTYTISSANDGEKRDPKNWILQGSNDGEEFVDLDKQENQAFANRYQTKTYTVAKPGAYQYYRLNITANNGDTGQDGNTAPRIQLSEWDLLDGNGKTLVRRESSGDSSFSSLWRSKGNEEEWVYVDLGAPSAFDKVNLTWNTDSYATDYAIQVSDDAKEWKTVYSTDKGKGGEETCSFTKTTASYVRLLCQKAASNLYALSEMEVIGTNDLHYSVGDMPAAEADGTQKLTGGNWTLQRASEVKATGEQLSAAYDDKSWLPATVPGTVLTSYLNAGAVPDPNIADQQLLISDSFFTADFWYRNHFVIPQSQQGKRTWLNFDAINWKADVYFNGENIGKIEGAFIRGKFDVTDLVNYGGENYLAVYIHKNDTPGSVTVQNKNDAGKNGGVLGADNPTIHASIGWDWVPTIRGRNIGIYEDVYLSYSQDATLSDPWAITDLDVENKDFTTSDVTLKTRVSNPSDKAVNAVVRGTITPGNIPFESEPVALAAGEVKDITVDTVTIQDPELWWPNTYGDQFLYTAQMEIAVNDVVSDSRSFKFGVRKFTYDTNKPMTIYCNGTRIICRGGNWGMDDSNLAATQEDYDIKIRMHAEANLTMIRNWVGMTNHQAFYDACDKYGILIWDDFWLANPGDGPNPNDETMFMANARDKILRNRSHAALALYCGRNEGNPPATLDKGFREETTKLDGTRHYISHSASDTVSGFGPYSVQNPKWYFQNTATTLHSERGMPNIPSYESLMAMLTEEHAWPIDDVWGMHDFTGGSAQNGNSFQNYMKNHYGEYNSLKDFARIAQMVNYENHKAMFEAMYPNNSNGILMWMSQSAWPSMVWQTYDYYYDTNAGYFGIKTANQPINAIYNPTTSQVVLSNATPNDEKGLVTTLKVYNQTGKLIHESSETKDIGSDETIGLMKAPIVAGATPLQYIRTTVEDAQGNLLASNFTWTNRSNDLDYKAMMNLGKVTLKTTKAILTQDGDTCRYAVTLTNDSDTPALMIRLKTMNDKGERVLPVYYDDNYISLMPGDSQTISFEFDRKYLNGGQPALSVEGWNITEAAVESEALAAADKTALGEAIEAAQEIELAGYAASTADAFKTALAEAERVNADRSASQNQVDKAVQVLKAAADGLILLGDVDGNGSIDAADALMALQSATQKITLDKRQTIAAEVDGKAGVAATDALLILQKATRKIQDFPQGK